MDRLAIASKDDKLRMILYYDYEDLGIQVPIIVTTCDLSIPQKENYRSQRLLTESQQEIVLANQGALMLESVAVNSSVSEKENELFFKQEGKGVSFRLPGF